MEEEKVEVLERTDRPECYVANGILICRCGKCVPEDYPLPNDYNNLNIDYSS
jgi:hypothetical protein